MLPIIEVPETLRNGLAHSRDIFCRPVCRAGTGRRELVYPVKHRREDKKRTALALDIVQQREQEGPFPPAHDAFDNRGLPLDLTRVIEGRGKHGVSERECARHRQWQGRWRRGEAVDAARRQAPPERFRPMGVRCRHGETKPFGALTKVVRLQRYGRKRLVIGQERAELTDAPRVLVADALHGERGRIMEPWSDRWASEIFHAFGTQRTGVESAQGRTEEAVTRHVRMRGGA